MPTPSSSLATLRPELGGSLEEFNLAMDRAGFIGARVLPVMDVAKASGDFGVIPIEQLLQTRNTARAPGGGYARGSFKFETANFATKEHGAEEPVDDNEAEVYRDYIDAELVATERARDAVLRNAEIRASDLLFNATTYTGAALTTNVSTEWSTAATCTPITDVNAARNKVWDGTGLWPNALIINRHVFHNLRNAAQIKDAISASGAGGATKLSDVSAQLLALVFDLKYVFVAGGAKNTANEASLTLGKIWDSEYAMVCRVAESNDLREPCIGRTFHFSADGSEIGARIESYREEQTRSQIIRARHQVQEKILYTACGHLLTNITA